MRAAVLDKLFQQMETDDRIFFLTADMGINLVEKFEERYPKRFLNVGIAEQNLIGVAAGLAESGMRPYVYTISNFLVHRCLEQIRNDIVIHNLPVVLLGTSTGFDNGPLGPTHHMLEDWGIISSLLGIDIYAPYNNNSAVKVINKTFTDKKPSYIRIAKGEGIQNVKTERLRINQSRLVVTYGSAIKKGINLAETEDIDYLVIDQLGKGSFEQLEKITRNYSEIIVVEDHFAHIGMYSYICQWANRKNWNIKISSICPEAYSLEVGFEFNDFVQKITNQVLFNE
jgi:transketolase